MHYNKSIIISRDQCQQSLLNNSNLSKKTLIIMQRLIKIKLTVSNKQLMNITQNSEHYLIRLLRPEVRHDRFYTIKLAKR